MSEFSLIKQLELLCFDPYPTAQFQETLMLLNHFKVLVEQMHEKNEFALLELFCKLKVKPPPPYCSSSSIEKITNLLISMDISTTISTVLLKQLKLIIIQLSECENCDAFHVLNDFRKLKLCIFAFRKSFLANNTALDAIIKLFVKKIIKLMKGIGISNYKTKFHILNVMKIIIIELGRQPEFATLIIMQLVPFFTCMQTNDADDTSRHIRFDDHYFTFLCIVKEIIASNNKYYFINLESSKTCLLHLKQIFDEKLILKNNQNTPSEMSEEEKYVIQHILRALEMCFSVNQVKCY